MLRQSCQNAVLLLLWAASSGVSAFGEGSVYDGSSTSSQTIVQRAVGTPGLSTLVAALTAGDLVDTLSGPGPFTVFAPTNEAFAKLPPLYLKLLLDPANIKTLQKLLTFHVAKGVDPIFSKDLTNGQKIGTVEGQAVGVKLLKARFKTTVQIENATVTTADVAASNGVVHIIDTVLMPPDLPPLPSGKNVAELAVATPDLSTLVAALKAGNLVDTLSGSGPFTVFAPTNEAFAKLPPLYLKLLLDPANIKTLQSLLTYHVVNAAVPVFSKGLTNGEKITTVQGTDVTVSVSKTFLKTTVEIDNSTVTAADVAASNGVVHIIDTVLMPADMPPMPGPSPDPSGNHLYFSLVIEDHERGGLLSTCSQVDAGPKMPASLFEPQNKQELDEYIQFSEIIYAFRTFKQSSCSDLGFAKFVGTGLYPVQWAPPAMMTPLCESKCDCTFNPTGPAQRGDCKDVRDIPGSGKFCSLCGPKYNAGATLYNYKKDV